MQNRYLATEGVQLKVDINIMTFFPINYICLQRKKSAQVSCDLIANEFLTFYNKHGYQFQESVVHHLLLHTIHVIKGQKNHKFGKTGMIFYAAFNHKLLSATICLSEFIWTKSQTAKKKMLRNKLFVVYKNITKFEIK